MNAPEFAEQLLRGLIADPDLEQMVLGDFEEEFRERLLNDGAPSARRWYWWHAMRTVPHLVALSHQRARAGEILRGYGVAFLSLDATATLILLVHGLLLAVGGRGLGALSGPGFGVSLLVGSTCALAAGHRLGSAPGPAPFLNVLLLSVSWVPFALAWRALLQLDWTTWYVAAFSIALVFFTACGALATLVTGASAPTDSPAIPQ